MDIFQETISRHLPAGAKHTTKCIEINCPCCVLMGESRPDSRKRGGVFLELSTTGYHCFNCGFKFRQDFDKPLNRKAKTFLKELGATNDEIRKVMFVYRKNQSEESQLLSKIFKPKKVNIDLDFKEDKLPKGTMLLHDAVNAIDSESHPAFRAYQYAFERGIEDNPMLLWCDSDDKKIKDYLIIPFIYKDKIVGYQARYTGHDPWMLSNRRFINSNPNSGKYLYGIENVFSEKKFLIINESLIDSYLYRGVGLMSHNPTFNQVNIINKFKGVKILVPDFGKSSDILIDIAIDNGWSVYFPFWDDGKDLGEATEEYGRIFMLNHIIKNHVNAPSSINLRRKILQ